MSGSSYCPRSAVYVQGTAPFSRIQATATEVSSPPEKAMPTRSPTGSLLRTLDTRLRYCPLPGRKIRAQVSIPGPADRRMGEGFDHGAGVQTPAVAAMIPQVAPADQLMRVNGLFSTIQSTMALGQEVWMVTVLELAFSIGMVLGGILVSTVLAKRSRMGMIVVSTFAFGGITVALGLSTNLWVFYAFMFLFGLFVPPFSTPFMTLFQETVEPEKQ